MVFERIKHLTCPLIIAVNKADRLEDSQLSQPCVVALVTHAQIVPMSALHGQNLDTFERLR